MNSQVSVIIPCYNNSSTIIETLTSVYNQSYKNIEIIVVNDGSTDDSEFIILNNQKDHPNLKYLKQENSGPSAARNKGTTIAEGEFLVFLDADDKIHNEYLSLCVGEFSKNKDLDLVYSDSEFFEAETGNYNLANYDPLTLLGENCFPIVAMIRSDAFRIIGKFDEKLRIAEDWEMWIRYTRQFSNVKKIDQSLFFYRKRYSKNSISDLNLNENIIDDAHLYVYNKHYGLYKKVGWNIKDLLSTRSNYLIFKDKYYNQWFKRFFRLLKGRKLNL